MSTLDAQSALDTQSPAEFTVPLAEAAAQLGVHEKTLRRWIRNQKIPAMLIPGPYGPEYRIPTSAITTANQVIDVVKVERPTDPQTLALAVARAMDEHQRSLLSTLAEQGAELSRVREELALMRTELTDRTQELLTALKSQTAPASPGPAPADWTPPAPPALTRPKRRWWLW